MTHSTAAVERWTDRDGWDRLVAASPQGSIFCRSALLDALDVGWEAWVLPGASGPRAAAVLFRDHAGVVQRAPLPFCLYQGIVLPPTDAPAHRRVPEQVDAVTGLLAGLESESRLSWCLHPGFEDLRPVSWFHHHEPARGTFRIDLRYTGIIDCDAGSGLEGVLAGSRSVRRQELRKASARFTVAGSHDLDLLDRLHALTFARQGLERSARETRLLRSIAAAALRDGFGEILVAWDGDGTPAGAVLFLFDETTAYYLVAANDPEFRSAGVSTLLFLSGVDRGIARGVRRVDVVGMNSPSRGDFKTSFGAVPAGYHVVTWEAP